VNEQSKGFIAANWFKLFLVGVAVLIFAIWLYREFKLDSCISNVDSEYSKQRDALCTAEKKDSNCDFNLLSPINPMNLINAVALNKQREQSVDQCYRRYSFK
jgi:hypothetical protein